MTKKHSHFALPTGAMVQEYRIIEVLGAGSFGIVYKAENKFFSEVVALKEFLPIEMAYRDKENSHVEPLSSDSEEAFQWARNKFLQEAKTLRELGTHDQHPNIVHVRQFIEANATAYMVMDFEEGVPLSSILAQRGILNEAEIKAIFGALLDALECVHGVSVWHRDIKPSNILIRADGTPVLIDFGAARKDAGNSDCSTIAIFSPAYAAAEQVCSIGRQGPWSDIYALGATLYHAVTGHRPTPAAERLQGSLNVPAAATAKKAFSPALLAAIDAALGLYPDERPQSISAWKTLFEARMKAQKNPAVPQRIHKLDEDKTEVVRHIPKSFSSTPQVQSITPNFFSSRLKFTFRLFQSASTALFAVAAASERFVKTIRPGIYYFSAVAFLTAIASAVFWMHGAQEAGNPADTFFSKHIKKAKIDHPTEKKSTAGAQANVLSDNPRTLPDALKKEAASPVQAQLTIDSVPAAARIFLDGKEKGTTPFKTTVSAGMHTMELRLDGHYAWNSKVLVEEENRISIRIPLLKKESL